MKALITRLQQVSSLRQVATLVTGTAVSQVIAVGASPILSRLYSPEDFGRFATFAAVSGVLASLATLRYDAAIMLPETSDDAAGVVGLCVVLSTAVAVVIGVLTGILYLGGWARVGLTDLGATAFLIPAVVWLQGVHLSLRQWDNRHGGYRRMARNGVLQSLSNATINIGAGVAGATGNGLVAGTVSAQAVATAAYIWSMWSERAVLLVPATKARIRTMAVRFRRFVQFSMPALLSGRLAQQSLVVLVGGYLGPVALGHVFLIIRIIGLPSTLVGTALSDVFYGNISRTPRAQAFPKILVFAGRLAALSLVIFGALALVLEWTFVPVFGPEWAGAVPLLRSLTLVALFGFVFAPLSALFNYFEAQKMNLIWQTGHLTSNIAVFVACHSLGLSLLQTLTVYAVKQALWYLAGTSALLWLARREYVVVTS